VTADNQLLAAIMDDLETELFLDMPALFALDKTGTPQLCRWLHGSINRLTARAIADALANYDRIADLDALETAAELQEVT
jgi:hypothetical protein